jgi:hypothetical protein
MRCRALEVARGLNMGKSLFLYWSGLAVLALASSLLLVANAQAQIEPLEPAPGEAAPAAKPAKAVEKAARKAEVKPAAKAVAPLRPEFQLCSSSTPWEDCLCPRERDFLESKLVAEGKTAAERFNDLVTDYNRRTPEEINKGLLTVITFVLGSGGWSDAQGLWSSVDRLTYVGYNLVLFDVASDEAREGLLQKLEKTGSYEVLRRSDTKWKRGLENLTDHLDSAREITERAKDLPIHFSCDSKDKPLACGQHFDVASPKTRKSWWWQEAWAGISHSKSYATPEEVSEFLLRKGRFARGC